MADLLDGGVLARLWPAVSATVALHTHEGMIREGHIVNVIVSPGTASRAFGSLQESGVVEYRQRSRGFVQMVEIDSFAVDPMHSHAPRYHGRARTDIQAERELPLDSLVRADPAPDPPAPRRDDAAVMTEMARAVTATAPAVAVPRPQVPELGDEPVDNLRRLFDLTFADVGRLFAISERHAHRWQRDGVPAARRRTVDALQAIGLTVIGGLGPPGAKAWLRAGSPSGEELVRSGQIAALAARAEAEKESPYT